MQIEINYPICKNYLGSLLYIGRRKPLLINKKKSGLLKVKMHSGNERINDVFKAKAAITIAVNEYREIFFIMRSLFPLDSCKRC